VSAQTSSTPTLETTGYVLARVGAGESHQRLTVLSAQHGRLMCLQRLSKQSSVTRADLFDYAEFVLEGPKSSGFYFVKEYALHTRHEGIGHSYEALKHASEFAEILARNSEHAADIPPLARLAQTAFAAWNTGVRPEVTAFKVLCLLAQNEGYPLREEFLTQLADADRAHAVDLLRTPLGEQTLERANAEALLESLRRWLKGFTDIWMP